MNKKLGKNKTEWKYRSPLKTKLSALLLSMGLLLPTGGVGARVLAADDNKTDDKHATASEPLPTVEGRDMTADINESRNRLEQTRKEMQKLREQSSALQAELDELELDSEELKKEQERIEKQLKYAEETVAQRQKEYEEIGKKLEKKRAEYQNRIKTMFYYRQRPWWAVLWNSNGIEGFFTNMRMIRAIASSDRSLLAELEQTQALADNSSKLAEETRKAYVDLLEEKKKAVEKLSQGIIDKKESKAQLNSLLTQRGTEEQDLEKTLAEQMAAQAIYEKNSRELAAKIAKMEQMNREKAQKEAEERRKQQEAKEGKSPDSSKPGQGAKPSGPKQGPSTPKWGNPVGDLDPSSGFVSMNHPAPVWPIPGSTEIWSPYGYRNSGFDAGNGYIHTGLDISGPNAAGSPVVAAWSGVVVTAQAPYQGQMIAPQANLVQINHGGGLGSGYWHLLDVVVQVGQVVQAGQVIGHCGSTGMSTGPHLHFEVYDEHNPNRGLRNTCDPKPYLGLK